jgi:hypothetical protein
MQRDQMHIRCPKCDWRPAPEDRWTCEPRCGTVWNTFWTRAMCPGCQRQWGETQCLACKAHSPHQHWYQAPSRPKTERRRRKRDLDTIEK